MEYLYYGLRAVLGFVSIYTMIFSVQLKAIKKSLFIKLFCASLFLFLHVFYSMVYIYIIKMLGNGYGYSDGALIVARCLIIAQECFILTFYVLIALFAVDAVNVFRSKTTFLHAGSAENTESNRGVLVLTFGIAGIVIFPLLGIVAWVMGRSDLNAMNANNASESYNMSMTKAGVVLGKIATFFTIAMFFLLIILISIAVQHLRYYF